MDRKTFTDFVQSHERTIERISKAAWDTHEAVRQTYGSRLPYGYHLTMVAEAVMEFGWSVVESEDDILPVIFGAYFHDSIEDARLTYHDVMKIASRWLDNRQTLMAAEIVYALTNDKGRTRAERAGAHYYQGIRDTPYAPMVKLCDRLANTSFSHRTMDEGNRHMLEVYRQEWPHFLKSITPLPDSERRLQLPATLIIEVEKLL